MGFLNIFRKSDAESTGLFRLCAGSFTVDRNGKINASTLPQSFPASFQRDISRAVLDTFRDAREADMLLAEVVVEFASLKLTAKELRGGAIIFLTPRMPGQR